MQFSYVDPRLCTILYIDSADSLLKSLVVDLNYAQFADSVGCTPGERFAAEYVVHKLFERDSTMSKTEFGVISPWSAASLSKHFAARHTQLCAPRFQQTSASIALYGL